MPPSLVTSPVDKPQLEKLWVNRAAAESLSTAELGLWANLSSTHRVYLGVGRVLLVWKVVNGQPYPVYSMQVESVNCSFAHGMRMALKGPNGYTYVEHQPTKLPGVPCFAWVPCFSEVRWAPADYNDSNEPKTLTVPMCVKMPSNPVKGLIENHVYVSSVKEFRQEWPQFRNLKF